LDDSYQVYVNRVARMTLPEAVQSQTQHLQPSPKFQRQPDGTFQVVPFPGYSVITPPWADDSKNSAFYEDLKAYQTRMIETLAPGLVVPLPPETFHMTIADLIWESAYVHASTDPQFDQKLQVCIANGFDKADHLVHGDGAIYWQVIGIFLRTRGIGICLAPRESTPYDRIANLRRTLYQNPDLIALGIDQQYNFTAHITLGYFTDAMLNLDRDRFCQNIETLNQFWLDTETFPDFCIHRAELRKFEDMTRYIRQADWAALDF
jgi:hypothetical protein